MPTSAYPSYWLWGPEATPGTVSPTLQNYLGIVDDDTEPPHPNEQTAHGAAGHRRGPWTYSGNEREYPWSLPVMPIDPRFPFECAIGARQKNVDTVHYGLIGNTEGVFTAGTAIDAGAARQLRITVDGTLRTISVDTDATTIGAVVTAMQAALRALTGLLETVVIDADGRIRIASTLLAPLGGLTVQEGVSDGLLAAFTTVTGITAEVLYEYIWEEDDTLPTISVYRAQPNLGAVAGEGIDQTYTYVKGSLDLSSSEGEPLKASLDLMAAHYVFRSGLSAGYRTESPTMPRDAPLRQWNMEMAELRNSSTSALFKDIEEIFSISAKWDNALSSKSARGHERAGVWSREPYAIVEEGGPEKHDVSIELHLEDELIHDEIYADDTLFDATFRWPRVPGSPEFLEVIFYDCKLGSCAIPHRAEGVLDATLPLLPRDSRVRWVSTEDITV